MGKPGRPKKPEAQRWRGVSVSVSGRDYLDLGRLALERFIRTGGGVAASFRTGEQPSVSSAVRYLLAQERQRRMVGQWIWYLGDFHDGVIAVRLVEPNTGTERVYEINDPDYALLAPGADERLTARIAEALYPSGYTIQPDSESSAQYKPIAPVPPTKKPSRRPSRKEKKP